MPFMTTLQPTDHGIATMHGCLFPMFSERLLTPAMVAQWCDSERHETAVTLLSSWSTPDPLSSTALVRNLLMVSLCVDNACRAGAHIQMTNGAVTSAKQQGERMVITVSMPYNKAGPYMGSLLHTHSLHIGLQCTPSKLLIR